MDVREKGRQGIKSLESDRVSDAALNQLLIHNLTQKEEIVDGMYYKYMIEHHQTNANSYSSYFHSNVVSAYAILATASMIYFKKFKMINVAAQLCIVGIMNQHYIEKNAMEMNAEVTQSYHDHKDNYKELLREKVKRVDLWGTFTSGLSRKNLSLYLQYLKL